MRNDPLVVGKLAVDELGDELDGAEAKHHLVAGQHDLQRLVAVGELAPEFGHRLARQDDLGLLVLAFELALGKGEPVAVGGDHAQRVAGDHHEQAVEVVADILLRHRVGDLGELVLEDLLRHANRHALVFGRGQPRIVGGRQGLQLEAAAAGLDGETLVVEAEGDVCRLGQRAQDVLQLSRPTVIAVSSPPPAPTALVLIWISMSVASRVSWSPCFSISTLDRIGRVWRFSTIPETDCRGRAGHRGRS